MRILGIDPGTAILGWGVIDFEKHTTHLIDYGVITTSPRMPMPERLMAIFHGLNEIIEQFNPEECAVEELFFNNNAKTAITVGEARGIVLLSAQIHTLKIYEYTPLEVKNALSGYGRAVKKQMQHLVKLLLKMDTVPKPDDAADALAIAITHTRYKKIRPGNMI